MTQPESNVDVLGQVMAQHEAVGRRLESVAHLVAVTSGKGGVGKSALTANLAAALAMDSWAVGVLDADIHGPSAALMLGARGQRVRIASGGAKPAVGVADVAVMSIDLLLESEDTATRWKHPGGLAEDAYVWRGTLEANVLREFLGDTDWGKLDYLLIDMPPGADRFDTLMRLVPRLSGALIVTTPTLASQIVVRRAIAAARAAGARILGLVENMAGFGANAQGDAPAGALAAETFAGQLELELLGSIGFDPQLATTTDAGRPYVLTHSETPIGEALQDLARAMREVIEK